MHINHPVHEISNQLVAFRGNLTQVVADIQSYLWHKVIEKCTTGNGKIFGVHLSDVI